MCRPQFASRLSGRPQPGVKNVLEDLGKDRAEEWSRRERERVDAIIKAWGTDAFQWYGRRFSRSALVQICRERPELVERWVQPLLGGGPEQRILHVRLDSFLVQLCPVVFEVRPELGLEFWKMLRQSNDGIVYDSASLAFEAHEGPEAEEARQLVLEEAFDDATLIYASTQSWSEYLQRQEVLQGPSWGTPQ
jgi:hypothetical protein